MSETPPINWLYVQTATTGAQFLLLELTVAVGIAAYVVVDLASTGLVEYGAGLTAFIVTAKATALLLCIFNPAGRQVTRMTGLAATPTAREPW